MQDTEEEQEESRPSIRIVHHQISAARCPMCTHEPEPALAILDQHAGGEQYSDPVDMDVRRLQQEDTGRGDLHRDDRRQGVQLRDNVIWRHPSDPRRERISKQGPWVRIRIAIAKRRLQEIREDFRHGLTSTSVAKQSRSNTLVVRENKEPAGEPMVRRRPSWAPYSSDLRAEEAPAQTERERRVRVDDEVEALGHGTS